MPTSVILIKMAKKLLDSRIRQCNNFSTNFYFTSIYMSLQICHNFHTSKFMDSNIQAFVEGMFEFYGHFINLNVWGRCYLHTKYNGNAGRRIHEVQCTCPASP